jgi:hypothetical protein
MAELQGRFGKLPRYDSYDINGTFKTSAGRRNPCSVHIILEES